MILQVNHEARELAMQYYRRRICIVRGCLYVDTKPDIFFYDILCISQHCAFLTAKRIEWAIESQNLALRIRGAWVLRREADFHDCMQFWFAGLDSLESFLLVVDADSVFDQNRDDGNPEQLREKIMECTQELFKQMAVDRKTKGIPWTTPTVEIQSMDSFQNIMKEL